jgi:hypothetical protein
MSLLYVHHVQVITIGPRYLNALIPVYKYPLPLIEDIFNNLKGADYFSELDITKAFHKFKIAPEDLKVTAFTWGNRQYVFVCAPFGIKTLSAKFQRVMDIV